MTKQHFEAFAREIASSNQDEVTRWAMARLVIRVAQEHNLRFDRARFVAACGLTEAS